MRELTLERPPEISTAQRNALVNVSNGGRIYNTDTNMEEVFEGGRWNARVGRAFTRAGGIYVFGSPNAAGAARTNLFVINPEANEYVYTSQMMGCTFSGLASGQNTVMLSERGTGFTTLNPVSFACSGRLSYNNGTANDLGGLVFEASSNQFYAYSAGTLRAINGSAVSGSLGAITALLCAGNGKVLVYAVTGQVRLYNGSTGAILTDVAIEANAISLFACYDGVTNTFAVLYTLAGQPKVAFIDAGTNALVGSLLVVGGGGSTTPRGIVYDNGRFFCLTRSTRQIDVINAATRTLETTINYTLIFALGNAHLVASGAGTMLLCATAATNAGCHLYSTQPPYNLLAHIRTPPIIPAAGANYFQHPGIYLP